MRRQSDNKYLNSTAANSVDFMQHTAKADGDTKKNQMSERYTEWEWGEESRLRRNWNSAMLIKLNQHMTLAQSADGTSSHFVIDHLLLSEFLYNRYT